MESFPTFLETGLATLNLFQPAVDVPVYSDCLKQEGGDPARTQTAVDFQTLPLPKQNDRLAIQTSRMINLLSDLRCVTMSLW